MTASATPVDVLDGRARADQDRRYTLRETIDYCARKAGVEAWDLDVAADAESHWAPRWYSAPGDLAHAPGWAGCDGLDLPWAGRVWCNPPFSDVWAWIEKAWHEWDTGRCAAIALLLPANRTEQPGWQQLVEYRRDGRDRSERFATHFLPRRTRFGHPGNASGDGVGSPPFGCVLLTWRPPRRDARAGQTSLFGGGL